MTTMDDALANLKKKLQGFSAEEEVVPLAYGKAVAKAMYVFSDVNGDWDPKDHPRDPHTGEFMESPSGYIFGKAKTATFSLGGEAKKVELKPGDMAFKTALGNLIVSHSDGSYSLHTHDGQIETIPAGNHSVIAGNVQSGKYQKVGENPGTLVKAKDKAEAAAKIADPAKFGAEKPLNHGPKPPAAPVTPSAEKVTFKNFVQETVTGTVVGKSASSLHVLGDDGIKYAVSPEMVADAKPSTPVAKLIPATPALKPGKDKFTAKQYAAYQKDAEGALLAMGSDGQPILSGSWVDLNGKPYLVHASPHGIGGVTAYRWVSTKQQASNLEKEDVFTLKTLSSAKAIPDPTGKPYGLPHPNSVAAEDIAKAAPKHGSLMAAAVNAAIPNTATAHKKHVAEAAGKVIQHQDPAGGKISQKDKNGWTLKSGDWVELDGKPVQVHASPNKGNVAIAKWVSTKQQASNNTYDFPASVLDNAVKIDDPTGKPYTPLTEKPKAEAPAAMTAPDGYVAARTVGGMTYTYEKKNGKWIITGGANYSIGVEITSQTILDELEAKAEAPNTTLDSPPAKAPVKDYADMTAYEKMVLPATVGATLTLPKNNGMWAKEEDGWHFYPYEGKQLDGAFSDADVVSHLEAVDKEVNSGGPKAPALADEETYTPMPADTPLADWEKELLGYSTSTTPYTLNSVDEEYLKDLPSGTMVHGKFGQSDYYAHKSYENAWSLIDGTAKGDWKQLDDQTAASVLNSAQALEVFPAGSSEITDVLTNPMNFPVEKTVHVNYEEYTWRKDGWYNSAGIPQVGNSADALDIDYEEKKALQDSIQGMQVGDQLHATSKSSGQEAIYEVKPDGLVYSLSSPDLPGKDKSFYADYLDKSIAQKFSFQILDASEKQGDAAPKQQQFVHPASGAVFLMAPGAKVYKHKTSEGGFIIVNEGEDNPINFFTTNGKQQKPKASQKNLASAYVEVSDWPGKVDVTEDKDHHETVVQPDITPGSLPTKALLENAGPGDAVYIFTKPGGVYNSHWTKTASGYWGDGSAGTLDHHSFVQTTASGPGEHWAYLFYPNGTSPNIPEDNDKAPWGGADAAGTPQVDPEPISTKPEAPKKGKKAAKPSLPTTVTLPDGKTIDLKPGEAYGHVKDPWGNEYFVHVTAGPKGWQSTNVTYSPTGSVAYWEKASKWTAASMKSYIKKEGGELLGDNPLVTDKIDFSQYGATEFTSTEYAPLYNEIGNYISEERAKFPIKMYSGGSIYSYASYDQFDGKSWHELDNQEKLSLFADYEQIAGAAVASLEPVAKMDLLGKSDKADFTKARTALTVIHRASVLARELNNPDSTWDDDKFAAEIAFVGSKVNKPGVSLSHWFKTRYPIGDAYQLMLSADQQRKFKNTLTDLDFDPYNATTEEYDTYAKSKGFPYLAGLTEAQQKTWVLSDLGDPTLTNAAKSQVTQAAELVKSKIVIAALAADLQKSQAKSPIKAPEHPTKGIFNKATLKSSYAWEASNGTKITIKHIGPDSWTMSTVQANGAPATLDSTDAIVSIMVNKALEDGTAVSESGEAAYGDVPVLSSFLKLEAKHGLTFNSAMNSQLSVVLGQEGGGAATKYGDLDLMRRWLWAHAAGDEIAKFNIEKAANGGHHPGTGPNGAIHLGDPNTSAGKAAHKALAEYLWQHPSGQKWLAGEYIPASEKKALGTHLGLTGEYVAEADITDSFMQWQKHHPLEDLMQFANGTGLASGGKATKPLNVPEASWNLVNGVEESTDLSGLLPAGVGISTMTDAELNTALANSTAVSQAGLMPYIGSLPVYLKRLALFGGTSASNDEHRLGLLQSIAAKAKAGEYMTDETPAWVSPSGAKFPLSPGATVYKSNGNNWDANTYIISSPATTEGGVPDSGWIVNAQGSMSKISGYQWNYVTAGSYAEPIFTLPSTVKWDQAKKDNPDLHETFWNESALIEEGTSTKFKSHETGALLTAALKNNTVLQNHYPSLYALHKSLPENVRQAVLAALQDANEPMLKVLDYKASKGHYASLGSKGLFDASQPWLPFLSKGMTSEEAVNNNWSPEAKDAYSAHFKVSVGDIGSHLNSLLNPEAQPISKGLPSFKDLVLTKTGKSLGGMHTKHVWVDQDGNEWMSKAFNNDPNAKARVDAETGAVRIAQMFGFRAPAANTQSIPGYSYAYVQHLAPATGDLTGKGPNDLPLKQLQQAMEEHVLDWLVSNHDTHRQNLMISPDGNVFGIDKGQAFKFFPQDKLAVGYLPPGNGEAVWFDQFYKGVQNGSVSKETADAVTKHVLRRAQQIAKDKDDDYRAELKTALQHRNFWPDEHPSREAFIDALVERKHNAFNDFVDFYKSVYAKSPYEFDIDTENLVPPKLDDHTHIAVSQDYADDVVKAAVHGKTMFFSSAHLEDSHLLMSTAKDKNGSTTLTGEAKIRKDGNDVLVEWLQKQTIESHVGHQQQSYNDYDSTPTDTIDPSHLPGNTEWFSAMVGGSKTVSSHNASGDHAYNASTLQQMEYAAGQVDLALLVLEAWKKEHPGEPFKGTVPMSGNYGVMAVELHTMEQQDAWESMLSTYKGYAEKVNAHKNTDAKISPHFQQTTYSPSKAAQDAVKAKQSAGKNFTAFHPAQIEDILKNAKNGDQITTKGTGFAGGGVVYTKEYGGWNAGTGTKESSGDLASYISDKQGQAGYEFTYSGPVPDYTPDPEEASATVTIGTKVLKVIKRANAQQNGHYDFDTGEQTLTGGEATNFSGGWSLGGHMYEVDFGNTVIEYRPWDSDIPLAQRGLLRFRKKDWNGQDDSIDDIFDVLRQMGLDLDPANETSMELFYWQHLYGILRDRKDGKTGKWATLHDTIMQAKKDNPNMSAEQELAVFKGAWSTALGADVVDKADWMPKFSRERLHAQGDDGESGFTSGHPYWHRPDYTLEDIRGWMGNHNTATSLSYGGSANDALPVALSGSMLSAEERARYYGSLAKSGASTASDSNKGSSAMVYTKPHESGSSYEVVYHPRVLLRTTNYAFGYDAYGDINAKSQHAYWDPKKMLTETTTELMIKNSVSVMDDIMALTFPNEGLRQKAIKAYKDRGITKLHGLPIEEVFVLNNSGLTKVKNHIYAEAKKNA